MVGTENADMNRGVGIKRGQLFRRRQLGRRHRRRILAIDDAIHGLVAHRRSEITLGLADDARGTIDRADPRVRFLLVGCFSQIEWDAAWSMSDMPR